jgi:histidyl-tRNA synthetase
MSPVWRGENPQFGRYREFYQCDVDIVGSASPLADVEILSMLGEAMTKLGFTGYRAVINNRKLLAGIARSAGVRPEQAGSIYRAVDKMDKIGPEGVLEEMVKNEVPADVASRAVNLFLMGKSVKSFADNAALLSELAGPLKDDAEATAGLEELRRIFDILSGMDLDLDRYRLDLALARGLDYYTGAIFEIIVDEPKIGALGGGGRYDKLMSLFSGRDLPTTGMTFGVERIIDVMFELGMIAPMSTASRALITVFDGSNESISASVGLTSELRAKDIPCEVYLNPGDKLGKQFGYADKLGIPYAVVLGPDEIAVGSATVKSLKVPPPNQQTVARGQLADILRT